MASVAAHAQDDFAGRDRFVDPTGGEITGYGRLDNFSINPEIIAPGQIVNVTMAFSMYTNYADTAVSDSYVNVNVFGNWWPYVEVASVLPARLKIAVPPRMEKTFAFQAPLAPGFHRIRIFWIDNDRPIHSYFGGIAKPGQFQRPPDMWTEIEFKVASVAGGASQILMPGQIRQPRDQSVYYQTGQDFCDPANYVNPVDGTRGDYMRFDRHFLYPKDVYPGDDATLIVRFTNLDLEHQTSKVSAAVFGNWRAEPLGVVLSNERRADAPVTVVKSVRFQAPPKAGKYKIRWMAADNKGVPQSFHGGFDLSGLQKTGPDIWTEFEFVVLPRPQEFMMSPEEADLVGAVAVDYLSENIYIEPLGGQIKNYLDVLSYDLSPENPTPGQRTALSVKFKNIGKQKDKLYLHVLGIPSTSIATFFLIEFC